MASLLSVLPHPTVTSWVELLQQRASQTPDFTVYQFLENGESTGDSRSFQQLHLRACAIAAHLHSHFPAQSRFLLLHPPGLAFIDAFFGCLYAGMIPVPVNPPRANRHKHRVVGVLENAHAAAILTTASDQARLSAMFDIPVLASDSLKEHDSSFQPYAAQASDLAFLQYTSGSTGSPKGVMVSQANLLANAFELHHGWGHRAGDVLVTWLPVFHDMGLIYGMLMPIYAGIAGVAMAPAAFLQRPLRWLHAIAHHQGTHTAAPNFAYALCAERASGEALADLDLSRWRVAVNGAEPIQAETLEAFTTAFAPCGFDRNVFCPGYGLAETTLKVTASAHHEPLCIHTFDTVALETGHAQLANSGTRLVSCGAAPQKGGVRIVDPQSHQLLPDGTIGEIWVYGPSVAGGYWQKPDHESFLAKLADEETRHLRTGDLGFFFEGQLYITGRIKDLMIVRGRNILPQDVEAVAVNAHPALQLDGSAAFSLERDDELAIACEVSRHALRSLDATAVVNAIRHAVWQAFDVDLKTVVLLKPLRLPKTSSGKVQRQACRQQLREGRLEILHQDVRESGHLATVEVDVAAFWQSDLEDQRAQLRDFLTRHLQALTGREIAADQRIGLDSLHLLSLVRQLEEDLQLQVGLSQLAHAQDLNSWLAALDPLQRRTHQGSSHDQDGLQPAAANQRGLWFINRQDPVHDPYTLTLGLRIAQPIDQVRAALPTWLKAHPALSMQFVEQDGALFVKPGAVDRIAVETLHHADASVDDLLRQRAAEPFDLTTQVPCRLHIASQEDETLLLLCVHHIVADFQALETLLRDLASALSGLALQPNIPLQSVRSQTADDAFWHSYLPQDLEPLTLAEGFPIDRDENQLRRMTFELPDNVAVALAGRARTADVTLNALLLAAYAATFQRYGINQPFTIGVPIDVRAHSGETACGYGIHTLPLLIQLQQPLLENVARDLWRMLEHRGMCTEDVARIHPQQGDHHPLFQTMFTLHQDRQIDGLASWFLTPDAQLTVADTTFTSLAVAPPRSDLPMSVTMAQQGSHLVGALDWRTGSLPENWAEDFLATFRDTLTHVATRGTSALQTRPPLPRPASLRTPAIKASYRSMLSQVLAQDRAALAMIKDTTRWTYGDLFGWTARIHHALKAAGVKRSDRVALICSRDPYWIASMLAIHACGAAYVPITSNLPQDRVAHMLENSQPTLALLTHDSPLAAGLSIPSIMVPELPEKASPLAHFHNPEAYDLAYILYTSGSTGKPKGVAIHHAAVSNFFDQLHALPFANKDLRALALTTPIFDISILEWLLPLSLGASLVFANDAHNDAISLMEAHQVNLIQATPTSLNMLLLQGWQPRQHVLTGGEAISHGLIEKLSSALAIWPCYGPTETCVWSGIHLASNQLASEIYQPIGGKFSATDLMVVDEQLHLLPRGSCGELAIGGIGLAFGYWQRPDLTAERFRPNPFSQEPGARLYLSGDLARCIVDDYFAFLGRNDQQLKWRGFRIEAGEIEQALMAQPEVQNAAVMLRRISADDERLVAFVVMNQRLDTKDLRQRLAQTLPAYMVPNHFEFVETFPLTASRKIDRRQLSQWPLSLAESSLAAASADATVLQLQELFSDVLAKPLVASDANFFELGGYSLLSLKLQDRIQRHFNVKISTKALLAEPTPQALAQLVKAAETLEGQVAQHILERPLVGIQRDFWVQEQMDRYRGQLHLAGYVDVRGPLDQPRLEQALRQIVARHQALRLTFVKSDDGLIQRDSEVAFPSLSAVDLTQDFDEYLRDFAYAPFDLSRAAFRFQLLRLAAEHHRLLLCFHHMIADGTSMTLFFQDLHAAYTGQCQADAADWLQQHFTAEQVAADAQFWLRQIQPNDALQQMATQKTPSPVRGFQLQYQTAAMPIEAQQAVVRLAQQQQTSPAVILQSLFAWWLHQLGAGARFTVAIPVSNRPAHLMDAFGPGITVLPAVFQPGMGWSMLLQQSKAQAEALLAHRRTTLGTILTAAREQLQGGDFRPWFMFNQVPQRQTHFEVEGLHFQVVEQPPRRSDFLLSLEVMETADAWQLRLSWARELFYPGLVEGWFRSLQSWIAQVDPLSPPLQPQPQALAFPWERQPDVMTLFKAQVAQHPQARAVLWEQNGIAHSLTYAALDQRIDALAKALVARGLGREQVVALFMNRGAANLIATLAVLRAGAAFLHISDALPKARVQTMLEGAAVTLALIGPDRSQDETTLPTLVLHDNGTLQEASSECRLPEVLPQQLAYLIFTSGTTGKPKAVAISREQLAVHIPRIIETYRIRQGDLTTHQASVSFDVMVDEVFAPLCAGCCILPIPEKIKTDFTTLAVWWRRYKPDFAHMNASLWKAWVDFIDHDAEMHLPRIMLVGAERMPPETVRAWLTRKQSGKTASELTLNGYGPTETTVTSTIEVVTESCLEHMENVPIGKAVPGCFIKIVTPDLFEVWPGVRGELVIGGPRVGRGYLNQPLITAERFRPDPFSGVAGARIYLSGDLAVAMPDGVLNVLGRMDHQVKLRGFRFELQDVERHLEALDAVHAAGAFVRDARVLVAVIACDVAADQWGNQVARWKAQLATELPEYMVPSQWIACAELPRLSNGKVDHKALQQFKIDIVEGDYQPTTEAERYLFELWCERWPQTTGSMHFFESGGDSILAIMQTAMLHQQGWRLSLEDYYHAPRLTDLAARMQRLQPSEGQAELTGPLAWPPLAAAMIAQGMTQQQNAYFLQMTLEVRGLLDRQRFQAALRSLLQDQDALRLCVAWNNDAQPVPRIKSDVRPDLQMRDWSLVSAAEMDDAVAQVMAEDRQQPFDLSHAPLWRMTLCCLNDQHHVLLFSAHHLVMDGWSLSPLFMTLLAHYDGQATRPQMPYRRYLAQLAQVDHDQARAYWRKQLAPVKSPTKLPLLQRQSPQFEVKHLHKWVDQSREWQDAATRHKVTVATLMQAAWACTLARFHDQDQVVFGTVSSGRTLGSDTYAQTVGLMIQSLPCVVDVQQTVGGLLEDLHQQLPSSSRHGTLPLREMQQSVPHWPAGTPLFESIVVVENMPIADDLEHHASGLQLRLLKMEEATELPLVLTLIPHGDQWEIRFSYRDPWWSEGEAAKLVHIWLKMMTALRNAQATTAVNTLGNEQSSVDGLVLDTPRTTLLDLLDATFTQHAAKAAFWDRDTVISFAEWRERSRSLAAALQQRGIGNGDLVGLALQPSADVHVAMVALWLCGAAFCPLDTTWPKARTAQLAAEGRFKLILTDDDLSLEDLTCLKISDLEAADTSLRPVNLDPQDIAYVLFTSGSTGKPKGVAVSHGALAHYAAFARDHYADDERGVPLFGNLAFDATQTTLWASVLRGQPLWLLDAPFDLLALAQWLKLPQHAAFLKLTPAHLHALEQIYGAWQLLPQTQVGTLVLGGEALTAAHVQICATLFPQATIINEYGPTEATVGCITWRVASDASDPIAIGHALPGTAAYVLDRHLRQVVAGAEGELYLAGPNLAQGYLMQPDATAAVFLPDPFSKLVGSRMYRSGDLALQRADGLLEFRGRMDSMVKWHGYRIEPGEIERCLRAFAGVKDSVVTLGDQGLSAFVMADAQVVTAYDLEQHAKGLLPSYMVPANFMVLAAFPLTSNGKVDRAALFAENATIEEPTTPLENEAELMIAGWLSEALAIDAPTTDAHFFALGGDSIRAIQISAKAQAQGYKLSPVQIMSEATISRIAQCLERNDDGQIVEDAPQSAPFTPILRWFAGLEENGSLRNVFNQSVMLRYEYVDDNASHLLLRAFRISVAAHDIFCARFEPHGFQQGDPAHISNGHFLDLRNVSVEEATAKRVAFCAELQQSFDVSRGHLLDYAVILEPRTARFFACCHHLACDGVTWRLVLTETAKNYAALVAGQAVEVQPAPSFFTWANKLIDYQPSLEAQRYWNALDLHHQVAQPADLSWRTAQTALMQLDQATTSALVQSGKSVEVLLLTAISGALLQEHERLLLEMEHHGRETAVDANVNRMAGWFTALYPLVLTGAADLAASLQTVETQLERARELSFDAAFCLTENAYQADVVFNYLGQLDGINPAPFSTFEPQEARNHFSADAVRTHPWDLGAWVREGCLELRWTFNASHTSEAQVKTHLAAIKDRLLALQSLLAQQKAKPATQALLTTEQRDALAAKYGTLQYVRPLLPIQKGMLYHDELAENSAYVSQMAVHFDHHLKPEMLKRAWFEICRRHAIFCEHFVWLGFDQPLAVRGSATEPQWYFWPANQAADHAERAADTQRKGFALERELPMRFDLFELADSYAFYWTFHHIVTDGWSNSIVFNELLACYEAFCEAREPALPSPVDLTSLIDLQVKQKPNTYWRSRLEHVPSAALLPPSASVSAPWLHEKVLATAVVDQIKSAARLAKVTPFTLLQAAYALMLQRQTGARHVCIGITHAGRDLDLAGVDRMVGPLIQTLPTAISFAVTKVSAWLQLLNKQHLQDRANGYVGLNSIRQVSGLASDHPLFEALLVLENYPLNAQLRQQFADVAVRDVQVQEQSHYALGLTITLNETCHIAFSGDGQKVNSDAGAACLQGFVAALHDLVNHLDQPLLRFTENLAMPHSQASKAREATAEVGNSEQVAKLSAIFAEVLGHESVVPHARFHDLGGDSIAAMVLVSRAHRAGFNFSLRDLLHHRTPMHLARFVASEVSTAAEAVPIGHEVTLLPMQRYFLEQQSALHTYFAMPIALRLAGDCGDVETWRKAASQVFDRQPAFRVAFYPSPEAKAVWRSGESHRFTVIETRIACEQADLIALTAPYHATASLENDPLIHVLLVKADQANYVIITAHHLVVDAVSWANILQDLSAAYAGVALNKLSFETFAQLSETAAAKPFHFEPSDIDLGQDPQAPFTFATQVEHRDRMLVDGALPSGTDSEFLFVASLFRALKLWQPHQEIALWRESHGRQELQNADSYCGWFTQMHLLQATAQGNLQAELLNIKRHCLKTGRAGKAGILFNYLGRRSGSLPGPFSEMLDLPFTHLRPPHAQPDFELEISLQLTANGIETSFRYGQQRLSKDRVAQLNQLWQQALIEVLQEAAGIHYFLPQDFPLLNLTDEALDQIHRVKPGFSDIWPLSPIQQGLLYHAIAAESEAYHEQLVLQLEGDLNTQHWAQAFAQTFANHDSLRTAFHWQPQPLQTVHPDAPLPIQVLDWSQESQPQERLAQFLESDRRTGFDLATPPLARVAIVRMVNVTTVVFSHHHLILDGWSSGLVLAEVVERYRALQAKQLLVPKPHASFADYLAWLQSQDEANMRAYWQAELAGLDSKTPLPFAHFNKQAKGSLEQTQRFSTAAQQALQAIMTTYGVTYSVAAQAAWSLLAARFTNTREPLFGVTFAGRPELLPELEWTPGLFIQTLPMQTGLAQARDMQTWLDDQQQRLISHQQNGAMSLSDIQAQSDIPAGTALFDTLLVFGTGFHAQPQLAEAIGLKLTGSQVHEQTHYPLSLTFLEREDGYAVRLTAKTTHYDEHGLTQLFEALEHTFEVMARHLQGPPRRLEIARPDQREAWIAVGQGTHFNVPCDYLEHPAHWRVLNSQHPHHIAVSDESGGQLSYAELGEDIRKVASALQQQGFKPSDGAVVCLTRDVSMIAVVLGVHAAGGYYIPVDPKYPHERIHYILENAGTDWVITHREHGELFAPSAQRIFVEDALQSVAKYQQVPHNTDALAYVLYTSGSTGKPKGVMISHRNIAALVAWSASYYPNEAWRAVLGGTSLCFDLSIFEIFATLSCGGQLVVTQNHLSLAGETKLQVSLINTVPTVIAELVELRAIPASCRFISLAGETLHNHVAQAILDSAPQARLINLYGPTEVTVYMTEQPITGSPVTLGKTFPMASMHVLDQWLRPLPLGTVGEGYVSGPHVTIGYVGKPALTAERYLPDPFATPSGAPSFGLRMYKTGDLLTRDKHGVLQFVGRVDFQVKINGFRIELGEIEARLNQHAQVSETVVLADRSNDVARLVAFVRSDVPDLADALRSDLAAHMPHYMVPSTIHVLASFPKTPNGKLDRKALLQLTGPSEAVVAPMVAASFPEAEVLKHLLVETLDGGYVDLHADFWQIGGHSLLAVRLLAKINTRFRIQLPLAAILEAASMLDLARSIQQASPSQHLPLTQQPEDAAKQLAPLQARLWFLCQLEAHSTAYNMPFAVQLRGQLNVDALNSSLQHLAKQHSVLRTCIADPDGQVYELRDRLDDLRVESLDRAEIERVLALEAETPFDLTQGPLLRCRLFRLGKDKHLLLISLHHLVFDGWSLGLFIADLQRNYAALKEQRSLPALPDLQYHDYASWEWQRQRRFLNAERSYWQQQLSNLPTPLPLPFDRAAHEANAGQYAWAMKPSLVNAVEGCAKDQQMTPFMVLQTAFAISLAQWCGVDDLVIGTPASSRPHPATEAMVGMFVNTLPLRHQLQQSSTFVEALQRTKAVTLAAFQNSAVTFDQIVDAVQPPRVADRPALFQVLFALQNLDTPKVALEGLACDVLQTAPPQAKLDLSFYVEPNESEWQLKVEFRADRFDKKTIADFAQRWLRQLEELLLHPQQKLHFHQSLVHTAIAVSTRKVTTQDEALQALILQVFNEVLPAAQALQADSDFFSSGGNSLLAARAIARLRQRLGRAVPLKAIFDHPTAAMLSNALGEGKHVGAAESLPPLPRGLRRAPLSLTQNGMWVMHQTEGHTGNFNMGRAAFLNGSLNLEALQHAVEQVHQQQALLRCLLDLTSGSPEWVLQEPAQTDFSYRDLSQSQAAEVQAEQAAAAFGLAPFDLQKAPPVRYLVLRIAPDRHLFVVVLHHIAGDEWSLQILFDQLLQHYQEQQPSLPENDHSYLDFAQWQRAWMRGAKLDQHVRFFKEALQQVPPQLALPTDFSRPASQGFDAASHTDTIVADTLQQLHTFAREQQGTLYQVCLAAFALLLAKHSQQQRFAIATPAANRPLPQLETLVGCFANTLIAAVDLPQQVTFRQAFQRLREHLFELQRHQALPFEMLVRHLNPPRDDSRHPIAQVGFALQNVPRKAHNMQHIAIESFSLGKQQARFDIELYLHEENDQLLVNWIYKTELFAKETMTSFNSQWQHLLQAVMANPDGKLQEFQLEARDVQDALDVDAMSEAELDALLGDLMDEDLT